MHEVRIFIQRRRKLLARATMLLALGISGVLAILPRNAVDSHTIAQQAAVEPLQVPGSEASNVL